MREDCCPVTTITGLKLKIDILGALVWEESYKNEFTSSLALMRRNESKLSCGSSHD